MTHATTRPSHAQRLDTQIVPIIEGDSPTPNDIGATIERYVCDENDLVHDPNGHYDAYTQAGGPFVQIKGARWRVRNGRTRAGTQRWASGRFCLYEADHEWLAQNNGIYAFVVYEKHPKGIIPLYSRFVYPEYLDQQVLTADPWNDISKPLSSKEHGSEVRITWPNVFPDTGAEI